MPAWDECQGPIDRAALNGRRCYVGLDLSTTTDLTAAVAIFPSSDGFDVLAHFFGQRSGSRSESPAIGCLMMSGPRRGGSPRSLAP